MALVDSIRPKVKSKRDVRLRREFSRRCQMSPYAFMQQNLFEKIVFIAISCVDNNSLSSIAVMVSRRHMRRRVFAQCHSNKIDKKRETNRWTVKSHLEQAEAAAATIHRRFYFRLFLTFLLACSGTCDLWLPMCAFAVTPVEKWEMPLRGSEKYRHFWNNQFPHCVVTFRRYCLNSKNLERIELYRWILSFENIVRAMQTVDSLHFRARCLINYSIWPFGVTCPNSKKNRAPFFRQAVRRREVKFPKFSLENIRFRHCGAFSRSVEWLKICRASQPEHNLQPEPKVYSNKPVAFFSLARHSFVWKKQVKCE